MNRIYLQLLKKILNSRQRAQTKKALSFHRFFPILLVTAFLQGDSSPLSKEEKTRSASLAKKSSDESPHSKRWRVWRKLHSTFRERFSIICKNCSDCKSCSKS